MDKSFGKTLVLSIVTVMTIAIVVAGGTYAYFQASVSSGTNTVTASGYKFNGTVTVTKEVPTNVAQLVPLNEGTNYASVPKAANAGCKYTPSGSSTSYDACVIYKVVFKNTGSSATTVKYSIKASTNSFTNLKIQPLTYTSSTYALTGTNKALTGTNAIDLGITSSSIAVNGSDTRYFAIYIANQSGDQTTADGAKSFNAEVIVTNAGGGSLAASF